MSSSQGPITTRTLEFISTFHFPATFGAPTRNPIPSTAFALDATLASQRETSGIAGTAQGPLWQIFSSNRGAPYAGTDLDDVGAQTVPPTQFSVASQRIPPATRIDINGVADPTRSGPGLSYLPGGVSAYKLGDLTGGPFDFAGRVVGGIGVYITDAMGNPDVPAMEFTAIEALRGPNSEAGNFGVAAADLAGDPMTDLDFLFPLSIVPPVGRIFLVGVLLPYVEQITRPANLSPGMFSDDGITARTVIAPMAGMTQPFGAIIAAREDPDRNLLAGDPFLNVNGLTQAEVQQIVDQSIDFSDGTRAAIRLPIGSATKMVIAVSNLRGLILAAHRMEDAPIFSYDVSLAKARCVTYYSSAPGQIPNIQPADVALLNGAGIPTGIAGSPGENGVAITTRSLAFLTQPFYPPGIDSSSFAPGPLFDLAAQNAVPSTFMSMGNALASPGMQSGIIFFPGATPLYKNGQLVGGLGISGDGVEQDDFVTNGGFRGFEPPSNIRVDNFSFGGVTIPYFKFPQLPGPGGDGN